MAVTASANLTSPPRRRLAAWSLGLALGGGVLALVAAIAGAIVPPAWYVQDVGPSAAMPALALVARTALVLSVGACSVALVVALVALVRGQRGWQAIVAVVIVVTAFPVVGTVYFVLGLFLYD